MRVLENQMKIISTSSFLALMAIHTANAEQPLQFPTRDALVETKSVASWATHLPPTITQTSYSVSEKKAKSVIKGQLFYSIMDYKAGIQIMVYNIGGLFYQEHPISPDAQTYVKTGATDVIAGHKCSVWKGVRAADNQQITTCVTSDGITLKTIIEGTIRGVFFKSIGEATGVIYGPQDLAQFKIPGGAVKRQ
jgi:hypothetical protein